MGRPFFIVVGLYHIALFILILGLVAGALLFAARAGRTPQEQAPSFEEGMSVFLPDTPVPEFTLYAPDGAEVTPTSWNGQPYVLVFWATWCAECQTVLDAILHVHREPPVHGRVALALVNVAENPAVAGTWARERRIDGPVLFDPQGIAATALGIGHVPAVVIVDEYGYVHDRLFGPITPQQYAARVGTALPADEHALFPVAPRGP